MAEKTTFIMLDRNIMKWRWYKNPNTMRVFVHLLLKANVKDHKLYDLTIRRGQAVVSTESLAENLGLTFSQVRTALGHLKKTGEITSESTNQFQVITIVNYNLYQSNLASNFASQSQTNRKQIATQSQRYNKDNNDNNDNNIYKGSSEKKLPQKNSSFAFLEGVTEL